MIDACFTCDAKCKVACETCVKDNMFMVAGEIIVAGKMDHETVVRGVARDIQMDSFIDDLQHCQQGIESPRLRETVSCRQHKRQRERKKTGEGGQSEEGEQNREERESVRKSERGKEQGGDGEEEERKHVKKDVTGWTVVTRNERQRKMVQIFVKVDEAKVTPMEVSLTDGKVEDVMRQIQKDEDVYVTMHRKVLRRNEKLKSCGVTDGCTIHVTNRMWSGGRHKDKKNKSEEKQTMNSERPEQKRDGESRSGEGPEMIPMDEALRR